MARFPPLQNPGWVYTPGAAGPDSRVLEWEANVELVGPTDFGPCIPGTPAFTRGDPALQEPIDYAAPDILGVVGDWQNMWLVLQIIASSNLSWNCPCHPPGYDGPLCGPFSSGSVTGSVYSPTGPPRSFPPGTTDDPLIVDMDGNPCTSDTLILGRDFVLGFLTPASLPTFYFELAGDGNHIRATLRVYATVYYGKPAVTPPPPPPPAWPQPSLLGMVPAPCATCQPS